MDIEEIERAIASVPAEVQTEIIARHARGIGHKGGSTTKERYGRQHFVDMQNKRWATQRAKNKRKLT